MIFIIFLIAATLIISNYYLKSPREISSYHQVNNKLFFKIKSLSSLDYELTLPEGIIFSKDDKLSITILEEIHTTEKSLYNDVMQQRYGVKPLKYDQLKNITLFVNGIKKYDINDNLSLKIIFKDPSTGRVTESSL